MYNAKTSVISKYNGNHTGVLRTVDYPQPFAVGLFMNHNDRKDDCMPSIYCPICERDITPLNYKEFKKGLHDGLIWVHDDVVHRASDIEALRNGIN